MSRYTRKIEKALAEKGFHATVTWTAMAKEDADSGITGFYSEELDTAGYHVGTLGYSLKEALQVVATIKKRPA